MKLISKKIPGGKLIKVEYLLENGSLTHFKLFGDFFLYPETLLIPIEKSLIGVGIDDISTTIEQLLKNPLHFSDSSEALLLKKTKGQFIGVAPIDIENMIKEDAQ